MESFHMHKTQQIRYPFTDSQSFDDSYRPTVRKVMKCVSTHKVRLIHWKGSPTIHVRNNTGGGELYDIDDIKSDYERCQDHLRWSQRLNIGTRHVRKMFELAGIDYLKDLFILWQTKFTCAQIAKKIEMKAQHLGQIFKRNGYELTRGRRRPAAHHGEVENVADRDAPVISIARHFNVHWQTAKKLLTEVGLLRTDEIRKPFQRYKLSTAPRHW